MPVLEALYTPRTIECKNSYHEPPTLINGYYEFKPDETQFKFWKFLAPQEKSRLLKTYHDTGKCLLCSIDEELQR